VRGTFENRNSGHVKEPMRNIFNGFSAISAFHPATGIRWDQGHSQYRILAHVSGGLPPGPLIHRHQYSTMSSTGVAQPAIVTYIV